MNLTGEGHKIGVEGSLSLSSPGGVVFTLHSTGLPVSSAESGPLTRFIYTARYMYVYMCVGVPDGSDMHNFLTSYMYMLSSLKPVFYASQCYANECTSGIHVL